MDKKLLVEAKCIALQVDFLTTKEELSLFIGAIYTALVWGKHIDQQNVETKSLDKVAK